VAQHLTHHHQTAHSLKLFCGAGKSDRNETYNQMMFKYAAKVRFGKRNLGACTRATHF
jgi:hypothetical protein